MLVRIEIACIYGHW